MIVLQNTRSNVTNEHLKWNILSEKPDEIYINYISFIWSIENSKSLTPIEVLKNTKRRKIPVQYSLNFGNPVEVTQILQIQVAEETNFLDIMRLAQEINPKYRFLLDDTQEIPVVYSIGDIPNDAEKTMFWTLYVASTSSRPRSDLGRLIPFGGNIKHLFPKPGEELVFWMKSM
ncbi:UNVERIFIED_CONTAM: hypothetical protein NCL1_51374 [Trichonephila clavipes]